MQQPHSPVHNIHLALSAKATAAAADSKTGLRRCDKLWAGAKTIGFVSKYRDHGNTPNIGLHITGYFKPWPLLPYFFIAAYFSAFRFLSFICVVRIGKCSRPLLIKRRCSTFSEQTSGLLTLSAQENILQGFVLIWEMTIGKSYFRNSLILLNKEVICESYTWGHIKVGEIQIFQQKYMARQIHVERIFDKIQKL